MDGSSQSSPVEWNPALDDGTLHELPEYEGIGFRNGFNGSREWHDLAKSIRKFTDQKAIIDQVGRSRSISTGRLTSVFYYAYLDVGSNCAEDGLHESTVQAIINCVGEKDGIAIDVHPHNDYAGSRNWESEAQLYAHYDFFGHGMVDGFDIEHYADSDNLGPSSDSEPSSE